MHQQKRPKPEHTWRARCAWRLHPSGKTMCEWCEREDPGPNAFVDGVWWSGPLDRDRPCEGDHPAARRLERLRAELRRINESEWIRTAQDVKAAIATAVRETRGGS